MTIPTKILFGAALLTSFIFSLFSSPGPVEVILSIIAVWLFGLFLAAVKYGILRLFKKKSPFLDDLFWMVFLMSLLAFGGQYV